ncbi:unnamed protein product [Orchesella dallaii]|uniref:C2H2-type domain-containing protein n=1 Tax=Orchesella dallaii TaxID=48710 RepID=A0ABP1RCV2_9HEXA
MNQQENTVLEKEGSTELIPNPKSLESTTKCVSILPSTNTTDSPTDPQTPSEPAPTSSQSQTDSSNSGSSSGEVIKRFQTFKRASIYFNRVRKVPSFHCLICKRSFVTLILFEEHQRLHNEEKGLLLSQHQETIGPFYQPAYDDTQSNPKIRWISRHFERSHKGLTVEEDLSLLDPFSEEISSNKVKVDFSPRFRDRFVCRFCPCHPTFNKESDFEAHNRRAHPLSNGKDEEDENGVSFQLPPCGFCLVIQDLIERIHIGVPKPPLLTRKENHWHPNPFCITPSKSRSTTPSEDDSPPHSPPPCSSTSNSDYEEVASTSDTNSQQEEVPVTEEPNNDSNQDEAVDEDEIYQERLVEVGKRKFNGVEVLQLASSLEAKPNQEFFKCSICSFILPILKRTGKIKSFVKLKKHIRKMHKEKAHIVPKRKGHRHPPEQKIALPKRVKVLPRKFLDFELELPKVIAKASPPKDRPQVEEQPEIIVKVENEEKTEKVCDICGRPVTNNKWTDVILHKFSHMNNEERKAALERGEGGHLNGLLMSSLKRTVKGKAVPNDQQEGGDTEGQSKSNPPTCKWRYSWTTMHARKIMESYKKINPGGGGGQGHDEKQDEGDSKEEGYDWRKDTTEIAAVMNGVLAKVILAPPRKKETALEVEEGN